MRILIVDDEPIVLNSIKNLTNKLKPNWSVETALNSPIAQEKLLAHHYDILLTDINLPVINGLDLIKWCKDHSPSTNNAIISAYSEFDYAQTAMLLGVKHYVLKPIQEDHFEKILNDLEKICISDRQSFIQQQLESVVIGMPNESQKEENPLDPKKTDMQFLPFLVCIGALAQNNLSANSSFSEKSTWYKNNGLYTYLKSKLTGNENAYFFISPFNALTVIISREKEFSLGRTNELCNIFKNWLKDQDYVTVVSGPVIDKVSDIKRTQTQLLNLMPKLIRFGHTSFRSSDNFSEQRHNGKRDSNQRKSLQSYQNFWENLINYPDIDPAMWENIVETWFKQQLSQHECYKEIRHFVETGNKILENYQLQKFLEDSIYKSITRMFESALDKKSFINNSSKLLEKINKNIIENSADNVNFSRELLANSIKTFLEKNYDQSLSNNDLENKFSYSSVHIANVFKEYYKTTPLDYLYKFRIKTAMKLLSKNNNLNIAEVGQQCGFPDPSYFSKSFKKLTGYSPDAYRKIGNK